MITAMEIFTNPGDLEITIGQRRRGAKFAISISRGPGNNFKPLITSKPFAETQEDAIKVIEGTLESIREIMLKDFEEHKGLPPQYLNPDGLEIDRSKVLNPELIARILEELRQHQVAKTYAMLAPAC